MHLLLTDHLTCPRCGPAFGLILLAEEVAPDRRVREGRLGCSNCRDRFPIRGGFGDLRAPPRAEAGDGRAGPPHPSAPAAPAEAGRLRALLGLVEGPGLVVLHGSAARHAALLAGAVPELQVAAVDPAMAGWPDAPGVSRLMAAPGLPFFDARARGVVVDGDAGEALLREAARITARAGRLVILGAGAGVAAVLGAAGLGILARDAETIVAARV